MHEDLMRLEAMDQHDRAADRAARAAHRLEEARRQSDAEVAKAETGLAAVQAEAQALRQRELTAQRDLEQARTYRSRAQRALEQGMGDAEAAERQVARTSEQIDELETTLLECMEAADALADRLAEAQQQLQRSSEEREQFLETFDTLLNEQRQLEGEEARRVRDIAEELPADLRGRYEDHRVRGRWAVAIIRDGACNACNQVVRQQHVTDLRRGLLKPCMGCHRFLVLAEDDPARSDPEDP